MSDEITDTIHEDNEEMLRDAKRESALRHCNFCNKDENNVSFLVAGPTAFICGDCIQICADIVLNFLWNRGTQLQDTIKKIEKHGGIPVITGVSDQEIPKPNQPTAN